MEARSSFCFIILLLLPLCHAQCTLNVPVTQLVTALDLAGLIPDPDPEAFTLQDLTNLCFVRSSIDNSTFVQVRVSILYTFLRTTDQSAQITFSVCSGTFRFSFLDVNLVTQDRHYTTDMTREGCQNCQDRSTFARPTFCRLPDPCGTAPCANGGTCTCTGLSDFSCACAGNWGGATCNNCNVLCFNGGTLSVVSCTCSCVGGFTGSNCETCPLTCRNGGTLNTSSCTCDCADGYSGANCGTCPLTCENGGTLNAGSCTCVCADGYSGANCGILTGSSEQGCPNEEDSVWRIQWPATAPDSTQSVACPGDGNTPELGMAHRRCLAGGVWGSVNALECESVAVNTIRIRIREFVEGLEEPNATLTDGERRVFQNISQDLNVALQPPTGKEVPIPPQDLITVARYSEIVADLGENNGLFNEKSNETQEVVVDILSNILDERNAPAFETTAQNSTATDPFYDITSSPATSILQSTERVAVVITTTLTKEKNSFTISRPNIAKNGLRLSLNSLQTPVIFPGPCVTLPLFRNPERLPQIQLPRSFLLAARGIEIPSDNDTVEVVNVVMNNIENYLPTDVVSQVSENEGEAEVTLPASRVLSSQIAGYDGREVDTDEMVDVIFPLNERAQNFTAPSGRMKQFRCAFFNFTGGANQTGGWSYRGVETEVINDTHVRCSASHLTGFVILVNIVPAVGDPVPLEFITYIGCSISFLCLLASIIFFLSLRKELITKLHNFVHLNLCIALSLGLLLFLTGIQTATANIYACKVMTALLHYFFLATFTWTLCEGVLIYILLVKVFGANERKWVYLYLALGWALPVPVVVLTGGVRHDHYVIRSSFNPNHRHYEVIRACWLPNEMGVIFAFIGPMVAIIVVNAVLLTISLVSLAKDKCGRTSEIRSTRDEKVQKYRKVGKYLLKATIILVPVLGFTWIIGLFAVGEEGKVFAYLFVIANVFQGLFIFLLHVVRHEKVYDKLKDKLQNVYKRVSVATRSSLVNDNQAG